MTRGLLTHLGALGVGAGLSLALAVMSGPGEPPPPVELAAPRAPAVLIERSLPGISPSTLIALEQTQSDLSICRFERRLLRARLETYEGEYQEWPGQVEERFEPEAIESALASTVDGSGIAALTQLDCDEFPCVAVLEAVDPEQPCCMQLQRVLRDMPGYEDISRPSISGVVDGRPVMVVAIQPPGDPDGATSDTRTDWRLNDVYEGLQADAGEL